MLFESKLSHDEMDLGHDQSPSPSPRDVYFPDIVGLSLKWTRSHSKPAHLQIGLPTGPDEAGLGGEQKGTILKCLRGVNSSMVP